MTQLGHKYSSITSALFPSYSNFISLFSLFYFYYFFYHKCSSFFSIKPNPYSRLETITRFFLGHLEHNMGFITSLLISIPYDTLFLFSLLSFFPFFISLDSFYLLGNHRFSFFFFFQFSNRRKKQYPKLIFPFFFSIFWATKQRVDVAATEEGPNSHSMC